MSQKLLLGQFPPGIESRTTTPPNHIPKSQVLRSLISVVPSLFGTRDLFGRRQSFFMDQGRGDGSMTQAHWGIALNTGKTSFAYLLLICCVAQFLTGRLETPTLYKIA